MIIRVRRKAPPHWSCRRQRGMTDGESGRRSHWSHDEIWQRGESGHYRVSANNRNFFGSGVWSTYRGTSGYEVFPTDLRYFPSCVCKNGIVLADFKKSLSTYCSNKQNTTFIIQYTTEIYTKRCNAWLWCSVTSSVLRMWRLGNADLDLCGVWGHLGAGRRSGAQWAAARPQSQIMVTSRIDVSNV